MHVQVHVGLGVKIKIILLTLQLLTFHTEMKLDLKSMQSQYLHVQSWREKKIRMDPRRVENSSILFELSIVPCKHLLECMNLRRLVKLASLGRNDVSYKSKAYF